MKAKDIKALADEAYRLLDQSNSEAAHQKALQMLDNAPKDAESFLLLAEVAEENDRYDHALSWVDKGLLHHQNHEGLLLKKASILIDGFEEIDEAFAILTDLKSRLGNKSVAELKKEHDEEILLDIYLLLTDCFRLMGNFNQAFEHAKLAFDLAPHDENAILTKASAFFELGDYESALSLLEPLSCRENAADFYWLKARVECAKGNFRESDSAFSKAHDLEKDRYHRPFRLSQSKFFSCFEDALMALPDEIHEFINKASVQIKDIVPVELVKASLGTLSPEACISTSKSKKDSLTIFLFQKNIENLSCNHKEISDAIASALLHELSSVVMPS